MAETVAPNVAPDERLVKVGPLARLLTRPDIGALVGAVAVFFAFGYFARSVNWLGDPGIAAGWTDQAAQYGIVAVPVALLMIGGEFDLSAGVMIGSSGLLLGYLTTHAHLNIWPAMALVLVFGLLIGLVNGITVIKTKLPSFIVTLATFFVLQGVNAAGTLKLTGQTAIQDIDTANGFNSARRFFAGDLTHYGFKVKVLWWIGITLIGAWLLAKTRFGNWIYSAGGDPNAARNVGVPVARTKITLFMMTSGVAALMGIIEAIELRSMQAKEGIGLEFIFIICAVVGGCLLTGGFGSVIGTFFRRGHARHGPARDHRRAVGQQLDLHLPGRDPLRSGHAQYVDTKSRSESEMTMAHLLEADHISKYYGNIVALNDISAHVDAGEVTCILGDNGAGKSSFIKILSGVHQADKGRLLVEGEEVHFTSPRDARAAGIATVYQDLAMVPLMSIWRNFFLGAEPRKGFGPVQWFDSGKAKGIVRRELSAMGIDIRDPDQAVGTLSGGEKQSVAIARAVYFGARVLILDEPTSALGVKQAGVVLKYILQARERGVAVIFITHNPHHAYPVGDRFVILNRGQSLGAFEKSEIDRQELVRLMAGGKELAELEHELEAIKVEI